MLSDYLFPQQQKQIAFILTLYYKICYSAIFLSIHVIKIVFFLKENKNDDELRYTLYFHFISLLHFGSVQSFNIDLIKRAFVQLKVVNLML